MMMNTKKMGLFLGLFALCGAIIAGISATFNRREFEELDKNYKPHC